MSFFVPLGININIGLHLFAEKYASHEEEGLGAFGAVMAFIIIYTITDIAMKIYTAVAKRCEKDWVELEEIKGEEAKKPSRVSVFDICAELTALCVIPYHYMFCPAYRITCFAGLSGLHC